MEADFSKITRRVASTTGQDSLDRRKKLFKDEMSKSSFRNSSPRGDASVVLTGFGVPPKITKKGISMPNGSESFLDEEESAKMLA